MRAAHVQHSIHPCAAFKGTCIERHLGVIIPPVHKQHGIQLKGMAVDLNHHPVCCLIARIKFPVKVDKASCMPSAVKDKGCCQLLAICACQCGSTTMMLYTVSLGLMESDPCSGCSMLLNTEHRARAIAETCMTNALLASTATHTMVHASVQQFAFKLCSVHSAIRSVQVPACSWRCCFDRAKQSIGTAQNTHSACE